MASLYHMTGEQTVIQQRIQYDIEFHYILTYIITFFLGGLGLGSFLILSAAVLLTGDDRSMFQPVVWSPQRLSELEAL